MSPNPPPKSPTAPPPLEKSLPGSNQSIPPTQLNPSLGTVNPIYQVSLRVELLFLFFFFFFEILFEIVVWDMGVRLRSSVQLFLYSIILLLKLCLLNISLPQLLSLF